jgi:choloylglycine hydrolase
MNQPKIITTMKTKLFFIILMTWAISLPEVKACTGITLRTEDNHTIAARTIEWAGEPLTTMLVIVPRGQQQISRLPDGSLNGKHFVAEYGYVGVAVEDDAYIMEGLNEVGLSAGLFYFPEYGEYMPYKAA